MKLRIHIASGAVSLIALLAGSVFAAGPYPPTDWPASIDPTKKVHYYVVDSALNPPNENWVQTLTVLSGGDQNMASTCMGGFGSLKATANYINVADTAFYEWNTNAMFDILVEVYGDAALLNPNSATPAARMWQFREGTTGSPYPSKTVTPPGYPVEAKNFRWNWLLYSITNDVLPDGQLTNRYVGSVPAVAAGNTNYGGINGGTIRIGASSSVGFLNGVTIRAIAFGELGAFGITNDVNQFAPPDTSCDPIPDSNLVGIDFDAGATNKLKLNEADPVTYNPAAGPAGNQRKAVMVSSTLNFGILDNYLGKPCNPNMVMKVCVDFYDDPAFASQVPSVQFGPESFATDASPDCPPTLYPASGLHTMLGTGQWIRRSWVIPGVNLNGVNTAPLTGGPRFTTYNGEVAVSRFYIAALRTSGPLAGQDPLAECFVDPLVCQGAYGNAVELDLAKDLRNGLDVGTSGSDQNMVVETAGPIDDQRLSVRPAWDDVTPRNVNLNFAITGTPAPLGPSSQGNVHLAIIATYYDDPALIGKGFRPQVWKKDSAGTIVFSYMDPPHNMVLGGTGKWRDAYWEIGAIRFDGVNQSPQAAARFECEGPIHITRLRYHVIRPCGPNANENPLIQKVALTAGVETDGQVKLSWPNLAPQAQVQGVSALGLPWANFTGTPTTEGEQRVLRFPPEAVQFFRLDITPPQ